MFFYVQLWQHPTDRRPTIQERVQATSEGHAVVLVMRRHHLKSVDRAWISPSAHQPPTVKLFDVLVRGKIRSWRQEIAPSPAKQAAAEEEMARIRSKIQKLLSLASSSNQHEAARAAAKAHDLQLRYHIHLTQEERQAIYSQKGK